MALGVVGEAPSEEERKAEMVVRGKERIDPQTESITWSRSFNELQTIYLTALTGEVRIFGYKFINQTTLKQLGGLVVKVVKVLSEIVGSILVLVVF